MSEQSDASEELEEFLASVMRTQKAKVDPTVIAACHASSTTAAMIASYFLALVDSGLDRDLAYKLTVGYQNQVLGFFLAAMADQSKAEKKEM